MARAHREVTDAELAVLQVLWERGPSTIRQIADELYPAGGPSHYATVQKLLERLEGKRCVSRRAAERAHVFRARVDRDALIGHQLRRMADKLCEGSLAPVISHLVRSSSLGDDEIEALRALVERLDRERGKGSP